MDLRAKIAEALEGRMSRLLREAGVATDLTDAAMGVVENHLDELEAEAQKGYSDDPWEHGYFQAIKDMRGEQ